MLSVGPDLFFKSRESSVIYSGLIQIWTKTYDEMKDNCFPNPICILGPKIPSIAPAHVTPKTSGLKSPIHVPVTVVYTLFKQLDEELI